MGAYLSEPLTNKTSSDETKDNISCGSSSMQGWRISQEDAHNHIIDFDTKTSLFAVYDGHGGAEVAKYCALKLPQFIKDLQAYKDGDLSKALEEAFLGFDASISTPEIIELLKGLSENGEMEADADETIDEEEEVHNLFEEASMPLDKIMAKYQEGKANQLLAKLGKGGSDVPASPFLRSKRLGGQDTGEAGAGCSTKLSKEEPESSVSSSVKDGEGEKSGEAQVSTSNGDIKPKVEEVKEEKAGSGEKATSAETSIPDSSVDESLPTSDSSTAKETVVTSPAKGDTCNGEVTNSKAEVKDNVTSSSNGEVNSSPSKKGKALAKTVVVSSTETAAEKTVSTRPNKRAAATLYDSLLDIINCSEDDESDSNDETFEGKEEATSSDDEEGAVNGVGGDSSEEDPDEEESSDEDSEQDEMDAFNMMIKNEPGSNSGCTAVIALLRENELFVANAGDSRCVVCRDGKAIDMSIDHKPEDEIELNRIIKAGGKVSSDGRVNGGLNLSRAIGDLGYKQNKELGPKEQMITALPDVKVLTIDPATDEFIVLACDGIWNSMSSQEVVDFVRCRLEKGVEKLSQICEEMFEHCLSPNTAGDGTGCDNMTAVIVKLKAVSNISKKRPSDDEAMDENQANKRTKTEENVSVSSSV